jgi:hypothetical protein
MQFCILWCNLVYFSRFGMFCQGKSGSPGKIWQPRSRVETIRLSWAECSEMELFCRAQAFLVIIKRQLWVKKRRFIAHHKTVQQWTAKRGFFLYTPFSSFFSFQPRKSVLIVEILKLCRSLIVKTSVEKVPKACAPHFTS